MYEGLAERIELGELPNEVVKKLQPHIAVTEASIRWYELQLTDGKPSEMLMYKRMTDYERAEMMAYKRLSNMLKALEYEQTYLEQYRKSREKKSN